MPKGTKSPYTTCTIEGCGRNHVAKGYCHSHYRRALDGRPLDTPIQDKRRASPGVRFDRKWRVDHATGCWPWTDHVSGGGYGQFRIRRGVQVPAHVYAYERKHGPVPDGLVLDHTCHPIDGTCPGGLACQHRICVNPDHVKPTTRGDNSRRCVPLHLRG